MNSTTPILTILLVAALVLVATAGKWVLPAQWHTVAALILGFCIVLLAFRAAAEYLSARGQTRRGSSFSIGWRPPLVVAVLSSTATLLAVMLWAWQPRADGDVLGAAWLLQNLPGVTLVALFGAVALGALGVLISTVVRSA